MIFILASASFLIQYAVRLALPDYPFLILACSIGPVLFYIYINQYKRAWLVGLPLVVSTDLISLHYGLHTALLTLCLLFLYILNTTLFTSVSRLSRFLMMFLYSIFFQLGTIGISLITIGFERIKFDYWILAGVIVWSCALSLTAIILQILIGNKKNSRGGYDVITT